MLQLVCMTVLAWSASAKCLGRKNSHETPNHPTEQNKFRGSLNVRLRCLLGNTPAPCVLHCNWPLPQTSQRGGARKTRQSSLNHHNQRINVYKITKRHSSLFELWVYSNTGAWEHDIRRERMVWSRCTTEKTRWIEAKNEERWGNSLQGL